MKGFCLSIAMVFLASAALAEEAQPAQQSSGLEKPRVFITESQSWEMRSNSGGRGGIWGSHSSGGARPQTAEIIKTFGERCPSVVINNLQDKADFIVALDHEGGKSMFQKKNKVAVFERTSGDTVISKSTMSLGGSVQEACDAVNKYWSENGAKLLSAKAAREAPTAPAAAPEPSVAAAKAPVAQIAVSSTPEGADIELDGSFVGNTPSSVEATPGEHVVAIHKKGYKDWQRKVKVSGGNINLRAELEAQ